LTVALDATPLYGPPGGIRRYVVELHAALVREFPEDRFLLLSDQGLSLSGLDRYWWLWGLNRRLAGVDVFHGTDFAVPYLKRRPAVLMIHDLSPWRFGDASERVRRRVPWLMRLHRYSVVLTPSCAIRDEVVAHFRVAASDVFAVPLAASALFRPVAEARGDYFLFVGTVEPRKNLATLLKAFALVREARPSCELWVVGRLVGGPGAGPTVNTAGGLDRPEACPTQGQPGVRYLGAVADEELPGLYSQAIAVCYPSLYEGFGLPVLEALQCGATVITSLDPALVEVGGGATVTVDALDVRGWAAAMLGAVPDPGRAMKRAAEFSWARTARMTREVYAEAIRRG
jgi:glycosyltransferase involved in cell wall biosynthesis